jgi:hypothetical protein
MLWPGDEQSVYELFLRLPTPCGREKEPFHRPHTDTFLCGTAYSEDRGQVDQLEDRYLGMVEASGSNPDLSISLLFSQATDWLENL